MAYGKSGQRQARLASCIEAAGTYGLSRKQATEIVDHCVTVVRDAYDSACTDLGITEAVHDRLWQREILHPSIFYRG